MPDKPKVGFYWCASCGGCEESVVDLAENILDVVQAVDIMFWPVAMDFKKSDVETMPDGALTVTFINGAIRNSEQEEMAHLLRKKSAYIIAFGSCAHLGGIPALANEFEKEEILRYVYEDAPSMSHGTKPYPNPETKINGHTLTLPEMHNVVRTLDQVIDVDYYIPGCPPAPKLLSAAVTALLTGNLPPKGAVLAPSTALCEECPKKDTKPEDLHFTEFKRPHLVKIDPEKCLLAQGIICMGPATRSGCEARCISGNMPCSGCFGPTPHVIDQGAKMLSAISSSINATTDSEIDTTLASIPDPLGTFYRYGLAGSLLRRKLTN
ncbi:MAG: oxidoreductase [Bacteroidota bacterium]